MDATEHTCERSSISTMSGILEISRFEFGKGPYYTIGLGF